MAGKNGSGGSGNARGAKTARNKRRRARRSANVKALSSLANDSLGGNATRTGVTPNPADPRTHHALAQLGNTLYGRNAAVKVLHPCGEASTFVTKWPDGAASTSVVMERRDEYKVSAPAAEGNWNCMVFNLPFLVARQVALRWLVTATPDRDDIEYVLAEMISAAGNGSGEHVYPTFQINVGGKGIDGSLLVPSVLGDKRTTSDFEALFRSVRRTAFGVTTDLDSSDLYNEGRVVSGQWNADVTLATIVPAATSGDADTDPKPVDVYKWQVPPLTISDIVSSDEYCRQAEAKNGSYMPIRTFQATVSFVAAAEARPIEVERATRAEGINTDATVDLRLEGWAIGLSYWSDLDPHASLRLKVRECVELVPSGESVFSPFATPAYPDDPRAAQMIKEYSRCQPHDFPADYNELGTMLQNLIGGVGNALSNLGIPVISDIAKGATGLVTGPLGHGLANLLNGIL